MNEWMRVYIDISYIDNEKKTVLRMNGWKWEWDVWKDVDLYRTYVWRLYGRLY